MIVTRYFFILRILKLSLFNVVDPVHTARNKNVFQLGSQVEDLALVSGVGANKLELLRNEVCVSNFNHKRISRGQKTALSLESLDGTPARFVVFLFLGRQREKADLLVSVSSWIAYIFNGT